MIVIAVLYIYVCVILPCILFHLIMNKVECKRGENINKSHIAWEYIFLFYISMLFLVTGPGNIRDIGRYPTLIRLNEINLIPFHSSIFEEISNIILFLPFGFLLPLLWEQYASGWKTTGSGLLFSGCIELSQLLNRRITDIDDLMMNTLGVFIGWALFCLIQRIFACKFVIRKSIDSKQPNSSFLIRHEACLMLILAFTGLFFIYDPLLI